MAVEDVWNPESKIKVDPRAAKEKKEEGDQDAAYWEGKRKEARAKREFEEEERTAKQAKEREEHPPEPPIQIRGSVDLGHFDMQAEQDKLRQTIDQIQKDAKAQIAALDQKSEHYRDEWQKLQIKAVEDTLKAQIESLQKTIHDGLATPKDPNLLDRIKEIGQVAGMLGYSQPGATAGLPAELQLKMYEMEINEKQAERKFEWDKMISEREWKLALMKLEAENAARNAEIQSEREKRNIYISPFEAVGAAIARGLIDSGGEVPGVTTRKTKKKPAYVLPVEEGESGVTECPECGEPIAVAPTARSAVCSACETVISIKRTTTPKE